jgi:hypothetical protein
VSWRDDTSDRTQADLDELVDLALTAGQEQLDRHGEFYPFAVVLPTEGEAAVVEADVPAGADVVEVHERCWQALEADAEANRALAVVTNVGGPDGDAVAVALEHRDGVAIEVFLPYTTQGKVNGKKPAQKHRFGALQAVEGTPRVWTEA